MRIYQLQFFQLARGQHVARFRLCDHAEVIKPPFFRSALWSRTSDGSTHIAAALALAENRRMLLQLASVPDDSTVEWSCRDVGRAGVMDLVSVIARRGGGRALLMVDTKGSRSTPARLREQMAQATRSALSAMTSLALSSPPAWTKLAVIAGWRPGTPVPTEAKPLPALQREPSILDTVPEPQVWGFVPFCRDANRNEVFLALGRWEEFDEAPWTDMTDEVVPLPWSAWDPVPVEGYGDGARVELEQFAKRVRVSLQMKSSAHKAAMKKDRHGSRVANRIRGLRMASYGGHLKVGAANFVGETIAEEGPRMHWDWAPGMAPSAEAARSQLLEALALFDERKAEARRQERAEEAARHEQERAARDAAKPAESDPGAAADEG